ncbi:unnamed protein product [Toxocara canis]|uniref:C2H2-type domain-containing protein n=1 Tax=Toxocara canis TaxID=6265 RepID=A0A183V1V7_TOXCA|nr:unnamed protein product [Toxocara canis]
MEERRHKCPVEGCNKRYKNLQGARYHARQVHGITDETAGRVTPIEAISNASGSQSPLTQPPTPSKYANMRPYKCGQCSKRYKTVVGLNNHVQQAHQRVASTGSQNMTPNLVPVSPSAVSNSSTTHLHSSSTSIDSSHVGNSGMAGKPLMYSSQMGVTMSSAHAASAPPPAMRVSTQPLQTAPPPTAAGHQYHQQAMIIFASSVATTNQPTTTNIQVRTVGTISGGSRTNSMVESRVSYGGMVDGSQQTEQRGTHSVQSKMPQRVVSAGNLSVVGRSQYQHSQAMVHRVKMSTSTIGSGMGAQVVNVQTTQLSNSSVSSPQTSQTSRSQVFQQAQQS